jgi:hypothetical protein
MPSYTSPENLRRALGSFWNTIFQEKTTIAGYTQGVSEELIQDYYNLLEVVSSFSVKNCPVFHTTRWYPLVIRKSQFGRPPLVFRENDAVFGPQPETDTYFAGQVFRFGFPKTTKEKVYFFRPPVDFAGVSVLANRVVSPTYSLVRGKDFRFDRGDILFNTNPFADTRVPKTKVLSSGGAPVFFEDESGNKIEEEEIVLWAYHAELDQDNLFRSYGYLFDLELEDGETYHNILKALINSLAEGSSISSIKGLIASYLGAPVIVEFEEHVLEISQDDLGQVVITDRNAYRIPGNQSLVSGVFEGARLPAGFILTDVFVYQDYVSAGAWWNLLNPEGSVQLRTGLFNLPLQEPLAFSNGYEPLTRLTSGQYVFPVIGNQADRDLFNQTLNSRGFAEYLASAGQEVPPGQSRLIRPADFVFSNFLRGSTAALIINVADPVAVSRFSELYRTAEGLKTSHVYFVVFLKFSPTPETYQRLNECIDDNNDGTPDRNADGSLVLTSLIPPAASPVFYRDVQVTQLAFGQSPKNLVDMQVVGNVVKTGGDDQGGVSDGQSYAPPSPYSIPSGATTEQIQILFLTNFN